VSHREVRARSLSRISDPNPVEGNVLVVGQEHEVLGQGLRDEDPIERIGVVPWE
jgi:hypothetical protein